MLLKQVLMVFLTLRLTNLILPYQLFRYLFGNLVIQQYNSSVVKNLTFPTYTLILYPLSLILNP